MVDLNWTCLGPQERGLTASPALWKYTPAAQAAVNGQGAWSLALSINPSRKEQMQAPLVAKRTQHRKQLEAQHWPVMHGWTWTGFSSVRTQACLHHPLGLAELTVMRLNRSSEVEVNSWAQVYNLHPYFSLTTWTVPQWATSLPLKNDHCHAPHRMARLIQRLSTSLLGLLRDWFI